MNIKIKIVFFLMVVLSNSNNLAQNYGSWIEVDSLNIARVGHAIVVLPNGNVLVSGNDIDSIQTSCEIYEISTGKWRYTTPMNIPRTRHQMVLLSTNKILTIGGLFERSCEIFDPQTETWIMSDSMIVARKWGGFTTTTLKDNRILVVGGLTQDSLGAPFIFLNNCEIFDPVTEKWTTVSPMNLGRYDHTATLLNDGRVIISGGDTENFQTDECEIYDPLDNTWTIVAPMLESRYAHAEILLNNGDVYISGGGPSAGFLCEVYNVATNQWQSADDILGYRSFHKVYYLSSADMLFILGGDMYTTSEDTWEIYDPNTLTPLYRELFPINQTLVDNNVQLLNGNIMVAGSEEYDLYPIPHTWPSKRCWIFDFTADVPSADELEKSFSLIQNFPNPFNPQTKIIFYIPERSFVKLKVNDILGNEIKILVDEELDIGYHEITFDGSGLPSGVYFYTLQTPKFAQTNKMVLLK